VQTGQNVERNVLPRVSAVVLAMEKKDAISLPLIDGKIDTAAFFEGDTLFLKWTNDLFLHYWVQVHPYSHQTESLNAIPIMV